MLERFFPLRSERAQVGRPTRPDVSRLDQDESRASDGPVGSELAELVEVSRIPAHRRTRAADVRTGRDRRAGPALQGDLADGQGRESSLGPWIGFEEHVDRRPETVVDHEEVHPDLCGWLKNAE